jgi:tripeptidyl-peptidase-1
MFFRNVIPILIAICVFFGSSVASFQGISNLMMSVRAQNFTFRCVLDVHQHFRKVTDSVKVQTETHEVIFAVKKDNLELLEQALGEVSDPFHASYGKHWTKDEIQRYTNTPHRYERLSAYLVQKGFTISSQSTCCDYVTAVGSIREWNTFFNTKFHAYRAVSPAFPLSYRQRKHYRSDSSFTIPKEILSDIEHVFHVAEFPPPVASSLIVREVDEASMTSSTNSRTTSLRGSSPRESVSSISEQWIGVVNGYTTPALLNQLYDIRSNIGNNLTNQCTYQAGSWFSGADLVQFQDYFSLPHENVTTDIGHTQNDTLCRINEGVCAEANLDLQYIMAVAQHVPTIAYEWGDGLGQVDPWLAWILEVSNMTAPPDVISISYISYEDQFDAAYAKSFTTEALLLSLQGVTILAAAGDDGVSGYFVKKGTKSCGYYPMFPASCPFVTAIGGTTVREALVSVCVDVFFFFHANLYSILLVGS